MRSLRTGSVLAAAAVMVALPRHLVAQLHAAGFVSPISIVWNVVVLASAVAWAVLEALTMAHLSRAYAQTRKTALLVMMGAILVSIAATNAPSLVADSAGKSLTELLGVASLAHWLWAGATIAATLLVVIAAFAADAAQDDVTDWRKRANELAAALTDRADRAQERPQVAVQVNVGAPQTAQAPAWHAQLAERIASEPQASSTTLAQVFGVTPQAVRLTSAWRNRRNSEATR